MMEKIEAILYAPAVKNFVFAHPYITWAMLSVVLSSMILIPVMWKWPKAKRTK